MIKIKDMSKSYGKTKVLKNIDLELEDQKIYGLFGRNGVGKTTLLNLIANQIKVSKGTIELDGETIYENSRAVADICLVKERTIVSDDVKVKDIFQAAAILYKNWDESFKEKLVSEFNLKLKKKYNKLSRGNQTIVGLIIGLASRARFTLFDEPSLGLDAAHRDRFYNIILEDWEENPRTILISTHLIDEVTNLFEEIIILNDQKVFIQEEVSSLMEKAYYLSGREDLILSIIDEEKIIFRDSFGPTVIIAVFDDLSKETKEELMDREIEVSTIPLQKLFIFLTESSRSGEVA